MPFACLEAEIGEIACSVQRGAMITGGGGFSDRFPRPSYQDSAVEEYLSTAADSLNFSLFNRSGRAYPDISALGQNIPIVFQGQLVMVGGTSSSSPIVAGLLALLNGERLDGGYPPLGFLNPLLYKAYDQWPEIVRDVVAGNNSGGNLLLPPELNRDCPDGLPAHPGWDATAGLGSPRFGEMLKHLVKVPFEGRRKRPATRSTVV
jgi:tripeptidyl-peptidase-1